MTDRADHTERDLLVQSYLDGDVDAAARASIEADAELMDEVRAHERVRSELRRTEPVDTCPPSTVYWPGNFAG